MPSPTPTGSSDTSPQPFACIWPQVALLTALFCCNYMSRCALSPVSIAMEDALKVGHTQITALFFAQGVGFALTQCCSGLLCCALLPRHVVSLSLAVGGLFLLGLYCIHSYAQALGLFFLLGVGTGLYFPAAMAVLGSVIRDADWGKAIGLHELAPNLGFVCLPLLAEVCALWLGWQSLFLCMGVLSLLLAGLFVWRGRGGTATTSRPSFKGFGQLLRQPGTWIIMLLMCVALCGEFSVFSILQLFLVQDKGCTPESANLLISLSRGVTPVGVLLGGWLADRWLPLPVMRACLVVHALALLGMMAGHGTLLFTACCLQALSIAALFPVLFKALALAYPLAVQPIVLSLIMPPAGLTSNALMPWFFGLCGEYASFNWGFAYLVAMTCAGVALLPVLRHTKRTPAATPMPDKSKT